MTLEDFHRAINRVRRSFIRVDADETTYGLHIILRFELEQELLFGGLAVADLPEAWNARFEESLGVAVPNDRVGCLQDVHWAAGLFGYFPTYQLGNVISRADLGAAPGRRARRRRADRAGRLLGDQRLAARAPLRARPEADPGGDDRRTSCGGPIDPEPYLRYLRAKTTA